MQSLRLVGTKREPDVILSNHRAQAPATARGVTPNGASRTKRRLLASTDVVYEALCAALKSSFACYICHL